MTENEQKKCRFCGSALEQTFADLGMLPFANSYVKAQDAHRMEPFYPLHAFVCDSCHLVQLGEFQSPDEIFGDYAYFSSYSTSWLEHAKRYANYATERFGLDSTHRIMEIASNDGYLLQYFKQHRLKVLGIEPARNVAQVAKEAGIPTVTRFFGAQSAKEIAEEYGKADLLIGNNVLAHVPDLNDFVQGLKVILGSKGVVSMEFPHLLRLMEENQFDTIYHEHFSYFSFLTVERIFLHHGLTLFDVEELPTHGGSLRIFARHSQDRSREVSPRVGALKEKELEHRLNTLEPYKAFENKVKETKNRLLQTLIGIKREGKSIVGYGAAAKGNTLLNYCGIRTDYLDYVVDMSPHKQGRLLPGTHIPIHLVERIDQTKPDYILILPWNLKQEIVRQLEHAREWGAKFIVPIPEPVVV